VNGPAGSYLSHLFFYVLVLVLRHGFSPAQALGRIFILDFAYILRTFPSAPRLFSLKTKKYLRRHPMDCRLTIDDCRLEYTNLMENDY
jgi:hypothetical protein